MLYHFTSVNKLVNILDNDQFRLTPDIGTSAEQGQRRRSKDIYYMSFARSKTGQYHYPVSSYQSGAAMLVIDGRALMADGYTGKSVDYWQMPGAKNEMEDRIFSDQAYIPNASKYINEIHLLLKPKHGEDSYARDYRRIRSTVLMAKQQKIPVFVYDDTDAFNLLNKKKSKKLTAMPKPIKQDSSSTYFRKARNPFAPFIEMINVSSYDRLSPRAKKDLNNMVGWNRRDGIRQLANDIHNSRSSSDMRANLDKFLDQLKTLKITNLQDFADWLDNKFKPQ